MIKNAFEVNFDGIVGPTHNYGGLSYGNVASIKNQKAVSNPKKAALQGLKKMKFLSDLGIKQAVLPPHQRPYSPALKKLGFHGSYRDLLKKSSKQSPEIFFQCCSAAAMWTANAATVTPSADSPIHRVHFTPANLISKFHRSIEAKTTQRVLKKIFSDPKFFMHHSILPTVENFADEGAANHNRFCSSYGEPGFHLFVYGRQGNAEKIDIPKIYPARQTYEASSAIARQHQLKNSHFMLAQQNPRAIDAGVFHNDVISVANQNLFFYHESSFLDTDAVVGELSCKFEKLTQTEFILIPVLENVISLEDAVKSYLFNSQLVTLEDQSMCLIAPMECSEASHIKQFLEQEVLQNRSNPINSIYFTDLHESMANGGGPACLRLRVVLNEEEFAAAHQRVFLTEILYAELVAWVHKYYRDRLEPEDLADVNLLNESYSALDELTKILDLGSIYEFQRTGGKT